MKKTILICAPFSSRSGYGDHARDIYEALFNSDKYILRTIDVPWGDCPRNALKDDNKVHKAILNGYINNGNQLTSQPDIYIDIRIPNEFQQVGKFNIGITAGIETNAVSQVWLEGCNKMDLIIVPSQHSKKGFVSSVYDKIQQSPDGQQQQKIGELKIEKPIEVVFEGIDTDIFKQVDASKTHEKLFDDINDMVSENFAFLFVGQWGNGSLGEDRKDIGTMIKVFYESFANKEKQPALILKTNGPSYSIIDRETVLAKIKQVKHMFPSDWKLPNVYLLHGDFSKEEINSLYNHPKIKSMISFTHGEGFGRPLLEAALVGLPIIAPAWSGQTDFLSNTDHMLLGGKLDKVPNSAVWKDIIIQDSEWFYVDENQAYKALNQAFNDESAWTERGINYMKNNKMQYDLDVMEKELIHVIEQYTAQLSQEVSINLPKLKKVDNVEKNPIPQELKLPKLKKVGV